VIGRPPKALWLPPRKRFGKWAPKPVRLIKRGGPFSYARDGRVFNNRERLLPARSRGYYREYTVQTPGARDRGPRRIIAGGRGEYYYTDDHYASFRRIGF